MHTLPFVKRECVVGLCVLTSGRDGGRPSMGRRHNNGPALRLSVVVTAPPPSSLPTSATAASAGAYAADLGSLDAEGSFLWTLVSVSDSRNLSTVYEQSFASVRSPPTGAISQ
jgi:hypothetical protein